MPSDVGDFHIPTDLTGIRPATFNPHRSDNNLHAALGPACNEIRKVIRMLGPISKKKSDSTPLAQPINPLDNGKKAARQNPDEQLFLSFLKAFPYNGSISYIENRSMAGFAFDTNRLRDIEDFSRDWKDAEHEFIDGELEEKRKTLLQLCQDYMTEITANTFATRGNLYAVPPEWEIEQPKRFEEATSKLHEMADRIVSVHQALVRMGKKKLNV